MLGTLLSSIQTALSGFVRGFFIVAFLPTLFFVWANVALLRTVSLVSAKSLEPLWTADSVHMGIALIAISGFAVLLTFVQPWLLALLEGRHLPAFVKGALQRRQTDALDELKTRAAWHFREKGALETSATHWRESLATLLPDTAPVPESTAALIAALTDKRRRGAVIESSEIAAAYSGAPGAQRNSGMSPRQARDEMERVIRYAPDRSRHGFYEVQNRMQCTYPGDVYDPDPSSDNVLAPTAFGNVARTMRSYALRRYGIDLDIFWTRFQKVMADDGNSKLFDSLQSQKTLVDTAVTLFWLTVLIGLIWIPLLAAGRQNAFAFQVVALGVPLAAWAFYHLAVQAYLVFADHVRTSVDYYRFKVLRAFNITPPPGTKEERVIWERLGGFVGYANDKDVFIYAQEQR